MYSNFTLKFKILINRQFGFRNNNLKISRLYACGVLIDLQVVFKTVNRDILLEKLECYSIRGLANRWLSSFLKKCKQYISFYGVSPSIKKITCGVPQGFTIGPLLFLLYINDLQLVFSRSVIHHFADDTNLIFLSKILGTIESVINNEL